MWPSVSLPSSPYVPASGSSPQPTESITMARTRVIMGPGSRVQGPESRVQGSGCRVQEGADSGERRRLHALFCPRPVEPSYARFLAEPHQLTPGVLQILADD